MENLKLEVGVAIMDLGALGGQSEKVLAVVESIKNDPNFLSEFKANPQEALSKIGIELNEQEMGMLQKLGHLSEFEEEAMGVFSKIKGLFGFKDGH